LAPETESRFGSSSASARFYLLEYKLRRPELDKRIAELEIKLKKPPGARPAPGKRGPSSPRKR
jgi:hypothetical protein